MDQTELLGKKLLPTQPIDVVILAAGEGTRMHSSLAKVLHPLAGRPMIDYSVRLAHALTDRAPVVVVGRAADQIKHHLGTRARYVPPPARPR